MAKVAKVGDLVRNRAWGFVGVVVSDNECGWIETNTVEGSTPFARPDGLWDSSTEHIEVLFSVGDIVSGTPESDDKYIITNSNAVCEIIEFAEDGMSLKVLSHRTMNREGRVYHSIDYKYMEHADEYSEQLTKVSELEDAVETLIKQKRELKTENTELGNENISLVNEKDTLKQKVESLEKELDGLLQEGEPVTVDTAGSTITFSNYSDFIKFTKEAKTLSK